MSSLSNNSLPQPTVSDQIPQPGSSDNIFDNTRAVRFCCKSWKSKALQIFDSETNALLYTVDTKLRKPHLIFQSGDGGSEFGSATFHLLTTKIDVTVNGQPIELKTKKILATSYSYTSPAFGNNVLTWKSGSKWSTLDFVLLDEKAEPIARCTDPNWKLDYSGNIEFIESKINSEDVRKEIIVTGFALIYLAITTYYSAIV